MRVTMLGCGSSGGVPLIGCDCPVCISTNPKNNRTRVSVYIETGDAKLLIDTSPDMRQQALANNIRHVDAVLYTHAHADHIHGIDDLRSYNYLSGKEIPVYGEAETLETIQRHFPYAFLPKPESVWLRPALVAHVISEPKITVAGVPVTVFEQRHGKGRTIGYRIGDFAYSTDTDGLPESAFAALEGVDTWIVDCLRYEKSYSHSSLEQTLEWIVRVKPRLAVLTHMAHDFDYDKLSQELPSGVVPGYDGMLIEIQ